MGVLGSIYNTLTGQTDFHATPGNVQQKAFLDPNAAANKESLAAQLAARQGMSGPQAQNTQMALAAQNQFRQDQRGLISQLQQQAAGRGPSVAGLQMQQGLDQAIAAQQAQAASARGMSPALAQRMAAQQGAAMQQGSVNQAAQMRAQEQLAAQQSLGSMLAGARGQDIGIAAQQAQLNQGTSLANMQAQLQAQGQKDAMAQFYTGAGLGVDAQGFAAQQAAEQARLQQEMAAQGINAGIAQQNAAGQQQFWGGLISAGGALGAGALISDERRKEAIRDGSDEARGFLDALSARRFRYKGEGQEHLGVMAQDIERAPGGAGMVRDTPAGKVIDVPQGLGRLLAASASLNERLKKIEAGRGR